MQELPWKTTFVAQKPTKNNINWPNHSKKNPPPGHVVQESPLRPNHPGLQWPADQSRGRGSNQPGHPGALEATLGTPPTEVPAPFGAVVSGLCDVGFGCSGRFKTLPQTTLYWEKRRRLGDKKEAPSNKSSWTLLLRIILPHFVPG